MPTPTIPGLKQVDHQATTADSHHDNGAVAASNGFSTPRRPVSAPVGLSSPPAPITPPQRPLRRSASLQLLSSSYLQPDAYAVVFNDKGAVPVEQLPLSPDTKRKLISLESRMGEIQSQPPFGFRNLAEKSEFHATLEDVANDIEHETGVRLKIDPY